MPASFNTINMTTNKLFTLCLLSLLGLQSCQKNTDFLIADGRVGKLFKDTQLSKLDSLFPNDSIVRLYQPGNLAVVTEIKIYKKGGEKLLEIVPAKFGDSEKTINYVEIIDPRYKTAKGLHSKSVFSEFAKKYTISSIENMINNVMVSFEGQDFYIVIDKTHLPSELRFDSDAVISSSQIPDNAPVKYFSVSW